jgi:hemoglobin-like flavoprotein
VVNLLEDELNLGLTIEADGSDGVEASAWEVVDFRKRDAVQIVQESFERVARTPREAADTFYRLLFEIDPGSRALFHATDMGSQGQMLVSMLSAAVRGLDRMEELRPVLRDLGRRHSAYGVQLSHYDSVEQALLEMVRQLTGEHFNPDVRLAWARIYSEIAAEMLAGSASAPAASA